MPAEDKSLNKDFSDNFNKRQRIYSVSELTRDIKLILESSFDYIWVEGEVSGISRINTGTVFFTLKDEQAQIKCVLFFNQAAKLSFHLKNGLKVILFGRLAVYERAGNYQLYAEKVEPKGVGSLQLALEQLKERLEKEGLFSPQHKKPIPYLPSCIGVVTSPTGAAIKDFLKVIDRRFRDVEIIINPVRVQGDAAKEDIVRAINEFNQFAKAQVIVLARGGGSVEDLWAFNEEVVAYAIYKSRIPIISAIGHERDVTIADLVADLRAPTPSVAAELVLPKKEDLRQAVEDSIGRLSYNIRHTLELSDTSFKSAYRKLGLLNPVLKIPQYKQRLSDIKKNLDITAKNSLRLKQSHFQKTIEKLGVLSPLNILSRGYSISFKMPDEKIIRDVKILNKGDAIKTRVHNGEIISRVEQTLLSARPKT